MVDTGVIMQALEEQWLAYEDTIWQFDIVQHSTLASFETVESIMTSLPDVTSSVLQERLEIIIGDGDYHGWCVQIDGIENIRVYCETGNPWLVKARWMLSLLKETRMLPNVYCISMKSDVFMELEENAADVPRTWWSSVPKMHRLKKIFEHKHVDTGILYQVILERMMDSDANNLKQALEDTAVNPNVAHHVRARWSRKQAGQKQKQENGHYARTFHRHGMRVAAIARNEPVPMLQVEHSDVLTAFGKLVAAARRRPRQGEPKDERPFFLAPKPVTLEQVHLIDPETRYGAVTIQGDYCVTDKADGERMLFYVHTDGACFLINNALEVRSTGIVAKSSRLHGSVVDGEYIDAAAMRFPGQKSMFAAFDVYFRNGQSLINRPLFAEEPKPRGGARPPPPQRQLRPHEQLREAEAQADPDNGKGRYDIIKEMFEDIGFWNMSMANVALTVKKHRRASGASIFEAAKATLLDAQKLPYANDGLIFTPASLYVWGVYANKRPVSVTPEMSRWDRVFKWKPAHMNSIDFLVRERSEQRPGRKGFELMCGYNMVKNTPITVDDGMRYLHDPEERSQVLAMRERYEPAPFEPHTYLQENASHMWLEQGADGHCRALEGDVVTDDTIVECQYDVESKEWRPMRVREDKTRLYRQTRNISRAANDMSTARNIWMTIHEPVTPAMITGEERITMSDIEAKQSGIEERYYARDIARYHLLSVNMQNFHNLVIKKQLFEEPTVSYRRKLLELACGQAGDMSRWADAGYSVVVGIDMNRNNITDSMNGAYARAIRSAADSTARGDTHPPPSMAFLIGDCGKSFTTGEAFMDSPESEELWRSLTKTNVTSYVAPVAAAFNKGKKPIPEFDVVSCQFAIHYFFESSDILDTFLHNVADHLREGGYFVTSCMDGETVNDLLRAEGPVVTGRVAGNTVWAIHKGYTTFNPQTGDAFAKDIHVYLETTRQSIKEYLVPYSVLVERAASVGLSLHSSELFSRTFEREHRNRGELRHVLDKLSREHVQRRFSGLNRWAVFRKNET